MLYLEERLQLAKVGSVMVKKKLTNNAGGNISMKVDEDEDYQYFIVSPKQAGQLKYWNLRPEEVLVLRKNKKTKVNEKLEGEGQFTRETALHLNVFDQCPKVKSVIHSHPYESMGFVTFEDEIPLACENVMKFGRVPVLDFAPATTPELAQIVKEFLENNRDLSNLGAIAFCLRGHGIVVASNGDLDITLDHLERLEYNSKAINDYAAYAIVKDKIILPEYEEVGNE
ncbi:class II aldolase/adducin family protein [Mollicutes bacterium LVI A0039]|nr:class II aldolase/adducin family protein [Mollicutes bacterium LVI A0039]